LRIAAWEVAVEHVDRLRELDDVDFVRDLAALLPLRVISLVLGLPLADVAMFREWSEEITSAVGNHGKDPDRTRQVQDMFSAYISRPLDGWDGTVGSSVLSQIAGRTRGRAHARQVRPLRGGTSDRRQHHDDAPHLQQIIVSHGGGAIPYQRGRSRTRRSTSASGPPRSTCASRTSAPRCSASPPTPTSWSTTCGPRAVRGADDVRRTAAGSGRPVVADPVAGKLRIARGFSDWPGTRPASQRPARVGERDRIRRDSLKPVARNLASRRSRRRSAHGGCRRARRAGRAPG
jgi:hypothetical protein